jgi:hypothetical protein
LYQKCGLNGSQDLGGKTELIGHWHRLPIKVKSFIYETLSIALYLVLTIADPN